MTEDALISLSPDNQHTEQYADFVQNFAAACR